MYGIKRTTPLLDCAERVLGVNVEGLKMDLKAIMPLSIVLCVRYFGRWVFRCVFS
jgi:hypothetical protein